MDNGKLFQTDSSEYDMGNWTYINNCKTTMQSWQKFSEIRANKTACSVEVKLAASTCNYKTSHEVHQLHKDMYV